MRWVSAISTRVETELALVEVVDSARRALGPHRADLVLVFPSSQHRRAFDRIGAMLADSFPGARIVGCSASGVVGGGREVEREAAISLVVASLPDVLVRPFHVSPARLAELAESPMSWLDELDLVPEQQPAFVLLPDPYSVEIGPLLSGLDQAFPGLPKVGGLASGGQEPYSHGLWTDRERHRDGLIGLALVGDVELIPIVAQGCRPVGPPMVVTRGDGNRVHELDGRSALHAIDEVYAALDHDEQELFRRAPLVGVAVERALGPPQRGDWLVRNLVGVDRVASVVAVGALVEVGMSLQFHLRDAGAAADDLHLMLDRCQTLLGGASAAGALMFSCVGRGAWLYGKPDHDSTSFQGVLGPASLGGFFCNGEIGPVRGSSHMHGYTSSFGVFRPRGADWA
jgi:small ligand-binding sensory domain FIST